MQPWLFDALRWANTWGKSNRDSDIPSYGPSAKKSSRDFCIWHTWVFFVCPPSRIHATCATHHCEAYFALCTTLTMILQLTFIVKHHGTFASPRRECDLCNLVGELRVAWKKLSGYIYKSISERRNRASPRSDRDWLAQHPSVESTQDKQSTNHPFSSIGSNPVYTTRHSYPIVYQRYHHWHIEEGTIYNIYISHNALTLL